ncbi:MAG: hypothetical protein FK732_10480, partial [Asgard group archaeon]|nr:hypothetical protein [Asgard group archaeon]
MAGKNKELQRITYLINHGKYSEASEKLAEFEKKDLRNEIRIRALIIKALLHGYVGLWEKGLEIIESVIPECETFDNPLLKIDALYVKARCLFVGYQLKKSITSAEEAENLLKEKLKPDEDDYLMRKAWLLWIKGTSFSMMGDGKKSLKIAKQGLP